MEQQPAAEPRAMQQGIIWVNAIIEAWSRVARQSISQRRSQEQKPLNGGKTAPKASNNAIKC